MSAVECFFLGMQPSTATMGYRTFPRDPMRHTPFLVKATILIIIQEEWLSFIAPVGFIDWKIFLTKLERH